MCQILTNPNTFHKPMGSLGQTPSLSFTAVINMQFSFIPKAAGFTDRTALWSSSTHQRTMRGGKKMTQETWMSSRGSSKLPWESQKSNSCLEPRFAWHRVHQRSIDRTRAEKGGTPTCLSLHTSSKATLFDQRSNRVQRQQLFFPFIWCWVILLPLVHCLSQEIPSKNPPAASPQIAPKTYMILHLKNKISLDDPSS